MIIYCIEDINDLRYVGSTNRKLNTRLTEHRYKKRNRLPTSSGKLNLEYCIIYELETCEDSERLEREKYWINKIDCVNEIKYIGNKNMKRYYNKENHKENMKRYYHKHIEKRREYNRKYYHEKRK